MTTYLVTLSDMAQLLLRGEGSSWQASADRGATWVEVVQLHLRSAPGIWPTSGDSSALWVDVPSDDTPYRAARLAALQLGLPGEVTVVAPQPDVPVLGFPFGPGTARAG